MGTKPLHGFILCNGVGCFDIGRWLSFFPTSSIVCDRDESESLHVVGKLLQILKVSLKSLRDYRW